MLVLHAWWGLNPVITAFCDRLAAEGYTVFAPDLYDGAVATTIDAAQVLATALDARHVQAKATIAQASAFVAQYAGAAGSPIAVVGFSLGAYYALDLAATQPKLVRDVVLFYGSGGGDFTSARAAFLGHYAGRDPYEPPAAVDALEAALRDAGRDVQFHRYPGVGHWFFEQDCTDAFDAPAAALAWERTLAFLRRERRP